MSEPDATPRHDDEGDEDGGRDRIPGGWIAVTLALIVVVGAALGILQTDASVNEANTARETTRTAESALRAGVLESSALQLERDIEAEGEAFARRQTAIVRLAGNAGASVPPLTIGELLSAVETGTDLPRARSAEAVRALRLDAERLRLQQGALAETRVTWNDRSTQYTTAVSMLAVALFLVGFSVVLRGRRRTLFYALGVLFALAVVALAAIVRSLDIPETPDAAIAATALGSVESRDGRQDAAIAAYTRAIGIDGDFATPYSRRAAARFLEANPGFQQTGAVTDIGPSLQEAADDAQRALELGGDRDVLAYTLISLLALHGGEYDAAVTAADRAIAINSEVPDVRLVRSAAQAGRGEAEAARESATDALELLSGSVASERTRGLAAQYLTSLERVIATSPDRAALARELGQELVRTETEFNRDRPVSGAVPEGASATVQGLRYADGRLRLRLRWAGLPADTALTAIGFERPSPDGPWVQAPDLALFRTVTGSGREVLSVPLDRACTPTEVRVDLFLDGSPAGSVTGPGGSPTC